MKMNESLNLLRGDKVPLETAKSDVREKSMIIICIAGESGRPQPSVRTPCLQAASEKTRMAQQQLSSRQEAVIIP